MLICDEDVLLGDDVLVRLLPDLDPRTFGSGFRVGHVVAMGTDLLHDEPVIQLDDTGPRIYAAHIEWLRVIGWNDADGR